MATELIDIRSDQPDDPRYAACYASGSVFRPEPGSDAHRVEKGARRVVSRALCVLGHFGKLCFDCPCHTVTLHLGRRTT